MKKIIIAILAVFVSWQIMDFLIHGVFLMSSYEATASLWRPQAEMKMGLMYFVSLVSAASFVLIYAWFFKEKNMMTGIKFGLIFGIGVGVSMGYGMYAVMPLPYYMALSWFLGTTAETVVGGLITGLIIKE